MVSEPSAVPNPEYREPWDKYWERTRPNKNRPYDRSHLNVPMPPREKGSTPSSWLFVLFLVIILEQT